MFDAAKVAEEVFSVLHSFNYEVAIFNSAGDKVYEPKEATRFFTRPKNITVAFDDKGENSTLRVYLGQSVSVPKVQGLVDTLRKVATKFGLNYDNMKSDREISPKEFMYDRVFEGKALTGSSKSSYLKLEGARMIVRHCAAIDDNKHGARSRNVEKIFVENSSGERFLMPSTNMMAGRAMTRHISKGGGFHDDTGCKISEMAKQQKQLRACSSYCRKNKNKIEEGAEIAEACHIRAKTLRARLESIYRNYDKAIDEMDKEPDDLLLETDDEMLSEKVDALMKKMNLEDESVIDRPTCETVVRTLGENGLLEAKNTMITLPKLFGREVEEDAWHAFVDGHLDLMYNPEVTVPTRKSDPLLFQGLAKVAEALNPLTSMALGNLFAHLSTEIADGARDNLYFACAHRALDIAASATDLPPNPNREVVESDTYEDFCNGGMIVNESVRKFNEWIDGFSEENIFAAEDMRDEGPRFSQYDDRYDRLLEISVNAAERDFNVDDFLVMKGDDFYYGAPDLTDSEKEVSSDNLIELLKLYLDDQIEQELGQRNVDTDDTKNFGNLESVARRLLPQVVNRLENEGYLVTGLDATEDATFDGLDLDDVGIGDPAKVLDEVSKSSEENVDDGGLDDKEEILFGSKDDDLKPEDVLLPRNPQKDLENDVEVDADDDYINRLVTLAGMKSNDIRRR